MQQKYWTTEWGEGEIKTGQNTWVENTLYTNFRNFSITRHDFISFHECFPLSVVGSE